MSGSRFPNGLEASLTGNVTGNLSGDVATSSLNVGSGGAVTYVKKAAVSVDLPSIAAGVLSEVSVTVSGAVAGDAVIANPPAAINANLMFCGAYVSAADTVKIRVRNNHASTPVDEAAANWVFTLIR